MSSTPQRRLIAYKSLSSGVCVCGLPKFKKHCFCKPCYKNLPKKTQWALYSTVVEQYVAAYFDALLALKGNGRIEATTYEHILSQAAPEAGAVGL